MSAAARIGLLLLMVSGCQAPPPPVSTAPEVRHERPPLYRAPSQRARQLEGQIQEVDKNVQALREFLRKHEDQKR
jgi:hypothetical protein